MLKRNTVCVEYLLKENMGKFAIATEQKYLFNV